MKVLSKFFLAPDISHRNKLGAFFKSPYVKPCISAKDNQMERHSLIDLINYALKKGYILVTKNKNILNCKGKSCKSIVFNDANLTLEEMQQLLDLNAGMINDWLLCEHSMYYKIINPTIPFELNLRGIEK